MKKAYFVNNTMMNMCMCSCGMMISEFIGDANLYTE